MVREVNNWIVRMVAAMLLCAIGQSKAAHLELSILNPQGPSFSVVAQAGKVVSLSGTLQSEAPTQMVTTQSPGLAALAGAAYTLQPTSVLYSAWAYAANFAGGTGFAEGLTQIGNSSFLIAPDAGEKLGDPVNAWFHLVVVSTSGNAAERITASSGLLSFEAGSTPVVVHVGDTMRLVLQVDAYANLLHLGQWGSDVHFEFSFSPTPAPPPEPMDLLPVPEPSSTLLLALGVLLIGARASSANESRTD